MSDQKLKRLIYAFFFLSGLSALVYEVVWIRMLGRIMGNSVWSVSTVLTAFMGGLAIGSYVAGRIIDRVRDDRKVLRLYGWLEGGIGLYCLAIPLIERAFEPIYRYLYQNVNTGSEASFYVFSLVRFVVSAALLVFPTTLMGATLPILSRYFVDRFDRLGSTVGRLYATNTFGAVAGAFVSGFILVPNLGELGTILAAVLLNLAIAAAIILAARPVANVASPSKRASAAKAATAEAATEAPEPVLTSRAAVLTLLVSFGFAGAASMIYQVTWTRLISLVIGSTVYAFSLMVTAFILGLALGGTVFSTFVDKRKNLLVLLAGVEALIGLSALVLTVILGELPLYVVDAINAFGSRFWLLQAVIFAGIFLLILIPTMLMGGAFPIVSKIYTRSLADVGRSVGTVYSFNTLGSIIGSFVAGFVLIPIPSLGLQGTMEVGVVVSLMVAVVLLLMSFSRYPLRPSAAIPGVVAAGALFLLSTVKPWTQEVLMSGVYVYGPRYKNDVEDMKRLSQEEGKSDREVLRDFLLLPETIFYKEGVTATVAVRKDPDRGFIYLSINGKTDASNDVDMLTQVLSGELPMLFHGNAKDVCVIGLGSAVTLGSVLQHPVDHVDSIEISPEVYEAARYFSRDNFDALSNPKVSAIVEDGRNHLLLTNRKYDAIVSEPSNPWISGIGALFTREFFELAKEHLKPGGVICQWTNTYDMLPDEFRMVLGTLQSVFPHVTVWESVVGADYLLMGSVDEIPIDFAKLSERMASPNVVADLSRVGIKDPFDLLARFVMGGEDVVRYVGSSAVHTDDNNKLEFTLPKNMYNPEKSVIQLQDLLEGRRSVLPLLVGSPGDAAEKDSVRSRLQQIYEGRLSTLRGLLLLTRAVRSMELGSPDFGLVAEAEEALDRGVTLNPNDLDARRELYKLNHNKAQWMIEAERFEDALPVLERMTQLEPKNREPRRKSALILVRLSQDELARKDAVKAQELAERAVKLDTEVVEGHVMLSHALRARADVPGAIREMEMARKQAPTNPAILDSLAQIYLESHPNAKLGPKLAADLWLEAMRLDPGNLDYRSNHGTALLRARLFGEAIQSLDAVAKQEPKRASVHYNLGVAHYSTQQWRRAKESFERYLALDSGGANAGEAHFLLGCSLAAMSRPDDAIRELENAVNQKYVNQRPYLENPNLRSLQEDPRFKELLRKLAERKVALAPK